MVAKFSSNLKNTASLSSRYTKREEKSKEEIRFYITTQNGIKFPAFLTYEEGNKNRSGVCP